MYVILGTSGGGSLCIASRGEGGGSRPPVPMYAFGFALFEVSQSNSAQIADLCFIFVAKLLFCKIISEN